METKQTFENRRSIRKYSGEAIPDHVLGEIIHAGILSPSGKSIYPWELYVIRNKDTLSKLSHCRKGAALMLHQADAAIIVAADPDKSDTWIEDCSCVMTSMHLMATDRGVGSCWIQSRNRKAEDEKTSTEDYIKNMVNIPGNYKVEAILSLGMTSTVPEKRKPKEELLGKVHHENKR